MNFLQQIGRALTQPMFQGFGGRGGGYNFRGFGAGYDYKAEAGPLHLSGIILACLKWEQRASIEAEVVIQARDESGDWVNDSEHGALDVLANPNPFFDMAQLLDAIRFDYHISGNAYLYKARSAAGNVVELWWVPSWLIGPRWNEGGTSFIDCYEYAVNGEIYALPVANVVHFRNGIDPNSHGRKGLSDFAAVLREVCTDNEAGVIAAALCKNMGIPGVIISPKAGQDTELTKSQRASIGELWKEKFTGNRRGEPFIQSIPIDITMPGFNLQQMCFDKLRSIPETRITAAFGIPPAVLGLMAGMEHSKTKGGRGDEREQAYESCIIPTLYTLARALTRQLLAEMEDVKRYRVWFDLANVTCLQGDEFKKAERAVLLYEGGVFKRSEAREAVGLKADPKDDVFVEDTAHQAKPALPAASASAKPGNQSDGQENL